MMGRKLVRAVLATSLVSGALVAAPAAAAPGVTVAQGARGVGAPEVGSALSTVLGVRDPGPATPHAADGTDRRQGSAWGWPLAGQPDVVHRFDPPEMRWLAGHRGIDLAGLLGEPVLSVDAGVVAFSGVVAGVGIVSVDHPSGLRSTYQPVTDRVPRGSRVARGDRLGRLDEGGHCVLQHCLHLGARRGRHHYVDPTPLLLGVELALLPVER